ncbi:MAG: cadherin domain-containing protein [Rubripirellula sp.]
MSKSSCSKQSNRRTAANRTRDRRRRMLESLEPRCLLASLGGEVFIDTNGDGIRNEAEVGAADVRVYVDANNDGKFAVGELFTTTDEQGQYQFESLGAGDYNIRVLADAADQTSPRTYFGTGYTSIGDGTGTNPTQLFEMTESGEILPIGEPTSERIHGLVRTNSGKFIGVNHFTDSIYSVDPQTGLETLIAQSSSDIVAGLAYDPASDTIYTLVRKEDGLRLQSIDSVTGAVTTPEAAVGRLRVSNYGSRLYDIDLASQVSIDIPRGPGTPFSSTLDVRNSDGVLFGLQGRELKQYDITSGGSSAITRATLSQSIESISFDANDTLFGVSTLPSQLHTIDLDTGAVSAGIPITFEGASISGVAGFDIGPDGTHYLVDSTHLYTFDPVTGVATQAPNRGLPSVPIFTSLTASQDGSLFATLFSSTTPIAQIDPVTGLATALTAGSNNSPYSAIVASGSFDDGARALDLANVSDLAFDPSSGRIVGFDNNSDQFFQFTTDGVGTMLGTATRPLDSWSLAFNGTDFVMFDQGDNAKTSVIKVDPTTGAISEGFQASSRIPAESLFYTTRGNNPHRVTVSDTDLASVDFGVTRVKPTRDVETDYPTVISELVLDPLFASSNTHQLVELRGLPGGQLPSNTYLVVVSEDDNTMGQIQEIFDLSNQSLGANGYLVLTQFDSPHAIAADSAVLTSTGNGFAELPDGIYSDIETDDGRIGGVGIGQNGFFLIRTDVTPGIGDDIDLDDNGLADPDGVKSNWAVLDSVSAHTFVGTGEQAYGQILLAEQELSEDPTLRTVEPGTPIVVSNGSGYIARVGESVGSSPDDWIIGTAVESSGDSSGDLLELYGFGPHLPESMFFLERTLDHFGEANFVGGVRGTILQTSPLDPENPDATVLPPSPAVGYTILADENGNGIQDTFTLSADPNVIVNRILADVGFNPNFVLPTIPLTHAFPGVTISTAGDDNEPINFEVQAVRERNSFISSSNFVYSHVGVGFFNEGRKLRFEFDRPASEVSIVAIGAQTSSDPVYGKLEAYNSNDELIGEITSRPMIGANRQTITVAVDDIAYAIAYGSTEIAGSSPFGRLDGFAYKQSEATAVTDENGKYEIKRLFPGEYDVVVQSDPDNPLLGLSSTPIVIDKYENFVVGSNIRPNSIPVVEAEYAITIDENPAVGSTLGTVAATELDGQTLTFAILGNNPGGVLIDSTTGELTVGPDTVLDFEASPEVTFDVAITDPFITVLTRVTLTLNNVNEAPVVDQAMFLVTEGTLAGTSLGQVTATDPEGLLGQSISFAIVGGPNQDAFAIDPASGLVTLVDADAVDFEVSQQLRFTVRVSDDADPAASTEYEQVIQVADQNDPPTIATTEIVTDENPASRLIGRLVASDPDADQTHTFQLLGGTGADLFRVSQNGQVIVREGVSIDFEQGNSYTLRVRTIDSGAPPLAAESTVTITVNNVDESPVLTTSSATIAEDAVAGDVVATLVSSDPDGDDIATEIALLEGSDAANFAFDPATGILTVAEGANLDFETKPTQTVNFRVTTTGSETSNIVAFRINLTDANDRPIITTEQIVVSEAAVPGTVIGRYRIQVSDPDPNDRATLALVGGNAADRFILNPVSGFLHVAEGATFDADTESDPLTIEVQVTDVGGLSSTRVINVVVNGVNEAPRFTSDPPTSTTLESGAFYEFVIPDGAISDPEGREFFVSVFDQTGQLPSWLNFNAATRTLSGFATPESVGTHNLTLRAFEPGPLELKTDQTFSLTVDAGTEALTNKRDRLDVDANNSVSPIDALRIINFLSRYGTNASVSVPRQFSGFVDTSGDGFVTAFDALLVVNGLKQIPTSAASGEQFGLPTDDSDDTNDTALAEYLTESSLF